MTDVVSGHAEHLSPSFIKLLGLLGYGRVMVRGEGVWLWDREERKYFDALAGFGTFNLGHNHPRLVRALEDMLARRPIHVCHTGPTEHGVEAARALAASVPELPIALLSSTGGEAVESAMKLARAATRRNGFVYCAGGFHGTTFGALSIMGKERMRAPFEPLLGACTSVPFGDTDALAQALAQKPAAFIIEPIQAEAGVRLPPEGYLRAARELCKQNNTLLVFDEVQTGLGRTGADYAFQAAGVVPDVLVLAKALSGGLVPAAATLTTREISERAYGNSDRFDLHGSTFSGMALACACIVETLAVVRDERLSERAGRAGERLVARLRAGLAGHPLVRDIRGRGLLVGVELGAPRSGLIQKLAAPLVDALSEKLFGQWIALRLLEAGVLCQPAAHDWDVLKIEPPLIAGEAELDDLADKVIAVLGESKSAARIVGAAVKRLDEQRRRQWSFR